jgi:hypothetical protein
VEAVLRDVFGGFEVGGAVGEPELDAAGGGEGGVGGELRGFPDVFVDEGGVGVAGAFGGFEDGRCGEGAIGGEVLEEGEVGGEGGDSDFVFGFEVGEKLEGSVGEGQEDGADGVGGIDEESDGEGEGVFGDGGDGFGVFVFEEEKIFRSETGDAGVVLAEFDGGVEDDELGGEVEGWEGRFGDGLG